MLARNLVATRERVNTGRRGFPGSVSISVGREVKCSPSEVVATGGILPIQSPVVRVLSRRSWPRKGRQQHQLWVIGKEFSMVVGTVVAL